MTCGRWDGRACRLPRRPISTSSSRRSTRSKAGSSDPDQWRAFRLVRGLYGQRQEDLHMIRVKIPQGMLTGEQLEALAEVAERYSRGFGHITTRQNIQFHFVQLHDAERAFEHLAATGLTTREACGNSVRNITACQYAGHRRRRGLRRHAVRRGADAVLPAPSAVGVAAAQVQDRLRGLRRGSRLHRHQRHRLARGGAQDRRRRRESGLPRHRGRRHRDDVAGRRRCCSSSCRPARCSTPPKRSCACSTASATTSTSTRTG